MSTFDQSGVDHGAIVLPVSGGALKGVGETFVPDLRTGSYRVAIPVAVPAGRRGFSPEIVLGYGSGQGNGPFGLGWTVSVPAIRRAVRTGIPTYTDEDLLVLDGNDLVPVGAWTPREDGGSARRYRMPGVRAFEDIRRRRDGRGEWWEVTASDGTISTFGRSPAARLSNGGRVFSWYVENRADPTGNEIRYEYVADEPCGQLYLARIDYVAVPADVAPGGWLYSVVLDYGDLGVDLGRTTEAAVRADAFSEFRAGFEIRTRLLCARILTTLNGTDQAGVVAELALTYARAAGNGTSLLARVDRVGVAADGERQADAPLTFTYSPWRRAGRVSVIRGPAPTWTTGVELVDRDGAALAGIAVMSPTGGTYLSHDGAGGLSRQPLAGPRSYLVGSNAWLLDMTGDGHPDLTYFGDTPGYFPAIPGEGWSKAATVLPTRMPLDPRHDNGRFADLDGDGRIDALRVVGRNFELYSNLGLDSAGRHLGWKQSARVPIPAGVRGIDFSSGLHRLADLSGDGPVDLVEVVTVPGVAAGTCCRRIRYWPHQGNGSFGAPRDLSLPGPASGDPLLTGFDARRMVFADFDGDGYDDAAYVTEHGVVLWLNQSGNAFGCPELISLEVAGAPAGPRPGDLASLRAVDWFGRGFAGLFWSTGQATDPIRHAYLCEGGKPYLLTGVDNHRGAAAAVTYRSSVEDMMRDGRDGQPWRTRTPFPVQVVARVEVSERFSRSSQLSVFTYHEGVWDGVEREFRGFARVEQDDADIATEGSDGGPHPRPVHRVSWYHVGVPGGANETDEPDLFAGQWRTADGEKVREAGPLIPVPGPPSGADRRRALRARSGLPARVEEFLGTDGPGRRPYKVIEYAYEVRLVETTVEGDDRGRISTAQRGVFAVLRRGERTTWWERGFDPLTRVHAELGHDAAGRARWVADIAVPRGRDPYREENQATRYLATCSERSFAGPAEGRIRDRLAWELRFEVDAKVESVPELLRALAERALPLQVIGAVIARYDGEPFDGLPVGQIGRYGLLVRKEHLVHTRATLAAAFAPGPAAPSGEAVPPWLTHDGARSAGWSAYPEEFRRSVEQWGKCGGYAWYGEAPGRPEGLWAVDGAFRYDLQRDGETGFGLTVGSRDAVGVETDVVLDPLRILPATVTRGDRLAQHATYDYRTQLPTSVVDENAGTTRFAFTPLGLLSTVSRIGAADSAADSSDCPGIRYSSALTAVDDTGDPSWVETTTHLLDESMRERITADVAEIAGSSGRAGTERLLPPLEVAAAVERSYSDGLGRLLASRTLVTGPVVSGADAGVDDAVDGLRLVAGADEALVRVSGWVGYDSKGQVARRYEPFFDRGWAFSGTPGGPLQHDPLHTSVERDPRGLPVRITSPDGTHRRFVHGIPRRLDDPDTFDPTPWESYEYDADDNAARTPDAPAAWLRNVDTPATVEIDPLGRIVRVTERDGTAADVTRLRYDVDGHAVEVVDALGRPSYRAAYDLDGRAWREWTLDGGVAVTIFDPLGTPVETRDARGVRTLHGYDELHRLVARWATAGRDRGFSLVETVAYGDGPAGPPDAAERNLRGRLWRRLDRAGVTEVERYDAHGHEAVRSRRWLAGGPTSSWPPLGPLAADETALAGPVTVTERRDRSGRVWLVSARTPAGEAAAALYVRDAAGDTVSVHAVTATGLAPILGARALDARGQEQGFVGHGPTSSRFVRDRRSGMLLRRMTRHATDGGGLYWDARIAHGPTGQVIALEETTPATPESISMAFEYDGRGRLTRADGVRWRARGVGAPWEPGEERPGTATTSYRYDSVGNLRAAKTTAAGFEEDLAIALAAGSNQVSSLAIARLGEEPSVVAYAVDGAGCVVAEGADRTFSWDHVHRLETASGPAGTTRCTYSDDGVVRLVSVHGADVIERHHLAGWVSVVPTSAGPQTSMLVTADGEPTGTPLAWLRRTGAGCQITYLLVDHLGTIRAALADDGSVVEARDSGPFGQPVRLRWKADEIDLPRALGFASGEEEQAAGLLLIGRRPYAPWVGRFLAPEPLDDLRRLSERSLTEPGDPADPPDRRVPAWALNPYAYAANSPLSVVDRAGRQGMTAEDCRNDIRVGTQLMGAGTGVLLAVGAILLAPETFGGSLLALAAGAGAAGFGIGDIVGETWVAPRVCRESPPTPPGVPVEDRAAAAQPQVPGTANPASGGVDSGGVARPTAPIDLGAAEKGEAASRVEGVPSRGTTGSDVTITETEPIVRPASHRR